MKINLEIHIFYEFVDQDRGAACWNLGRKGFIRLGVRGFNG